MLKMLAARSDRIMSPPLAQNPPGLKDAIGNVTSSQGTLASMHPLRTVHMRHVQRVCYLWLKQGRYLNLSRTSTTDGFRICSWTSATIDDEGARIPHLTRPYGALRHPTCLSCSRLFWGVKGGHTCLLGTSVSEVLQQCACTRRGSLHVSQRMITPLWCTNFDTWFRTTSACVAITHYSCGSIEGPTLPIQDWDPSTQQ